MTIRQNIQSVIDLIQQQRAASGGSSAKADEVQQAAIGAIAAGQGRPGAGRVTPEWQAYMLLFAGDPVNPQQLARLLPSDGTETNSAMQKERAYLVANGMCGAHTTDDMGEGGVTDALDQ